MKWVGEPESACTWVQSKDLINQDVIKRYENSMLKYFTPGKVSHCGHFCVIFHFTLAHFNYQYDISVVFVIFQMYFVYSSLFQIEKYGRIKTGATETGANFRSQLSWHGTK